MSSRKKAGGYYTRNVGQIEASVRGTHVPNRLKDAVKSVPDLKPAETLAERQAANRAGKAIWRKETTPKS